jgi:hypothetical protein
MNPFTAKLLKDLEAMNEEIDEVMFQLARPEGSNITIDNKDVWIMFDRVQHELGRVEMQLRMLSENENALLTMFDGEVNALQPASLIHVSGGTLKTTTRPNSPIQQHVLYSDNG